MYPGHKRTKRTDLGGLYEPWPVYDMEQAERDNAVRAARMAEKEAKAEQAVETHGKKGKQFGEP